MNGANMMGGPQMGGPGVNINLGGGAGAGGLNVNVGGGPQIAAGRGGLNVNVGGGPQMGGPQLGVPRMGIGGARAGVDLLGGRAGLAALGPQALFGGAQANMGLSFGAGVGLSPAGLGGGSMVAGASLFAQAGVGVFA